MVEYLAIRTDVRVRWTQKIGCVRCCCCCWLLSLYWAKAVEYGYDAICFDLTNVEILPRSLQYDTMTKMFAHSIYETHDFFIFSMKERYELGIYHVTLDVGFDAEYNWNFIYGFA